MVDTPGHLSHKQTGFINISEGSVYIGYQKVFILTEGNKGRRLEYEAEYHIVVGIVKASEQQPLSNTLINA